MIEWSEELSVGVPEMDEEHKDLIYMINRTEELLTLGQKDEAIEFFDRALMHYTDTHLSDEEEFMERIGYPKLEEHKKQHIIFRQKVAELKQSLEKGDLKGLQKAINLSWQWLFKHITGDDKEYGIYYQKHILHNKSAILKLSPIDKELRNIFTEFYFRIINTTHLSKFFHDAYQISELSRKQVEFVKSYLYALDNEELSKLKQFFQNVSIRHAKIGVNIEDLLELLDFLEEKLLVLAHSEVLRGVEKERIKEFVEFMKQESYKAYLKSAFERSIQSWRLHHGVLGELAQVHIETLEKMIGAIDGKDVRIAHFRECLLSKHMASTEFFIKGYGVKEIVNMAVVTHQRLHEQIVDILEYIKQKEYQKAYELSRQLVRDSDALEGFLLYIHLLWQKDPQGSFFDFLMDPINSDKMIGVVLMPTNPTKNAKEIFNRFNTVLVDVVNSSNQPEFFAFSYIDYKEDVYRAYIIHFSLFNQSKESAMQEILNFYKRAEEIICEDFTVRECLEDYIKIIPFDTHEVLEKFHFNRSELSLFIDKLEKVAKKNVVIDMRHFNDEVLKFAYEVKREYKVLEKLRRMRSEEESLFLELYAHPILDMHHHSIYAVELLSRIRIDANSDPINAGLFIDIVKKEKLTDEFDLMVLRHVKKFLNSLKKPLDFKLFVNLFPSSYFDVEIDKLVKELSLLAAKKSKGIVFEVTEQEDYDMERIIKTLQRYRGEIAIDDFGSGYSNFDKFVSLLKIENLRYLKIDGGLVKNVLDPYYKKTLSFLCSFAQQFDKDVIFEFVESEDIEKILQEIAKEHGFGQGFYYDKPKPLHAFIA